MNEAIQHQEPQGNGVLPCIICRTSFSGSIAKNQFYQILEHIDKLKQTGFKFEKHDRIDETDKITFDYVLCLYGI
jgi:hypothetical protein